VQRRPAQAFLHVPEVDNVADQIELPAFGVLQEVEQELGLAGTQAEVGVRNPDGVELQCLHGRLLTGWGAHRMRSGRVAVVTVR
jgi:hypothetical protein